MAKRQKPAARTPKAAAKVGVPKDGAAALAAVAAELDALAPDEFEPVNVDIPTAVSIIIAAVPHVTGLRSRIVAALPETDIQVVDRLGTYALAAWYAHLLALPRSTEQEVTSLLEEATPLREDLLVAAEALAHKRLLDPASVAAIRSGQGNLDKANDLVALAALFTAEWPRVEHKTTVEWAEVQRAGELGPKILVALGARDVPGESTQTTDPASRRVRAYTLLIRAYDECRHAIRYLRRKEGDAAAFAPSVHVGRGGRAAEGDDDDAPALQPAPAEPQATSRYGDGSEPFVS